MDGWWMGLPGRALGVVLWGGIWCEPRYHHAEGPRCGIGVVLWGESGVNLDTITSSAVPVHGLQTRRAGRWKTLAEACAPCRGAGGGGANGLENMLEYMNIWSGRSIESSTPAYARRLRRS